MSRSAKRMDLPMRQGVSPSCLAAPRMKHPLWVTWLDFLAHQLPSIPRTTWQQRMAQGDVYWDKNPHETAPTWVILTPTSPYEGGGCVYYWRSVTQETPIAAQAHLIYEDEHLLVVDKPHFLPMTPQGIYVQETLLARLKHQTQNPELSPLHRLDRETAGLVVFGKKASERNAYQALFRHREVTKTYEAIAWEAPHLTFPYCHKAHLMRHPDYFFCMIQASDPSLLPNSETWLLGYQVLQGGWGLYQLQTLTGKRHQIRVHMMNLGLPLYGDQFYPKPLMTTHPELESKPESEAEPLRLLAKTLSFQDPITHQNHDFQSSLSLRPPPNF